MGAVEATVRIIGELAWPVVALVSVILLRRQLGRLIIRLTHLKAPGVEATFAERAEAAREIAEAVIPEPLRSLTPDGRLLSDSPTLDDLLGESDHHPVGAVVRAWNLIEQFLGPPANNARVFSSTIRKLMNAGVLSDDLVGVATYLFDMRRDVVHGRIVPTPEAARSYVEAAWRLLSALRENSVGIVEIMDGRGHVTSATVPQRKP